MDAANAPARSPAPARRWALDLGFFVGASVAAVWAEIAPGDVAVALKLVPMGLLMVHLALRLRAGEVERRMAAFLLAGLAASTVGDIVIAYRFLGGIAAFFLAHVAYLVAMGRPRGRAALHVVAALPALAVGGTMGWILVGGGRLPAPLEVPVLVYMAVITSMLARAVARAFVHPVTRSARVFFAGAALFVTSDTLIALSRWVVDIPYRHVAIMGTYFAAQWLISTGAEPSAAKSP